MKLLKKMDPGTRALFSGALTLDLLPEVRLKSYPPTGVEGLKADAEQIRNYWNEVGFDIPEKYSGTIPSADELKKYESVCPGSTRKFLDLAQNELKIRSDAFAAVRRENMKICKIASIGQFYTFLIFISFIVGACFLGYFNMEKAACGAFGAAVAFAGVNAFVRLRSKDCREEPDSASKFNQEMIF